jgi:hypothetical protein
MNHGFEHVVHWLIFLFCSLPSEHLLISLSWKWKSRSNGLSNFLRLILVVKHGVAVASSRFKYLLSEGSQIFPNLNKVSGDALLLNSFHKKHLASLYCPGRYVHDEVPISDQTLCSMMSIFFKKIFCKHSRTAFLTNQLRRIPEPAFDLF